METLKIKSDIEKIEAICKKERNLAARVGLLCKEGYKVSERPMGSGGVLQVKETASEIRIQVSSAWGRYNYAHCVIIDKSTI
jgi:hypothetical protein